MKLSNVSTADLRRMSPGGLLRALAAEGADVNPYDAPIADLLAELGETRKPDETLLDALIRVVRAELLTDDAPKQPAPAKKKPDDAAGMTGLSTRELAICKETGVNPATYARNKARRDAARSGARGGAL
jgi:hypothetical protein